MKYSASRLDKLWLFCESRAPRGSHKITCTTQLRIAITQILHQLQERVALLQLVKVSAARQAIGKRH
jgi:hypothetical protein